MSLNKLVPDDAVGLPGNTWGSLGHFWLRSGVMVYATAAAFKELLGFNSAWDFIKFEAAWGFKNVLLGRLL